MLASSHKKKYKVDIPSNKISHATPSNIHHKNPSTNWTERRKFYFTPPRSRIHNYGAIFGTQYYVYPCIADILFSRPERKSYTWERSVTRFIPV